MKPVTVLLLLGVFACVTLSLLGVGLGARGGGPPLSPEARERWRERLLRPGPVARADMAVTGCGRTGDTVRVEPGRPCQLEIARAGARVRTLELEPLSGGRVDVRLEPHEGPALPATVKDVTGRRGFDIPGAGARVRLTCTRPVAATAECPVSLRGSS
ncbi:hypothetical protein [Archangium primigenium]|uniref:hypothetical protein n=1 Tax=[Archangium] primigenium TaxID=2792470 RepID=UPI00195B73AF|nr:hypothetical protein [Archangium primigenium]MBM7116789.1 hypothetical protein [Archangium primigenium]